MRKEVTRREMEKKIPFLSLKAIDAPIAEELAGAASRVIESGYYLHGPETKAFERELAEATGTSECVGVSNGLDALRLITRAAMETGRLHRGDGVLVAANTYIASILPLTEMGLQPILIEPDERTFGIDWHLALRRFEEKGKEEKIRGLVTTHLYGNPSWDEEVAAKLRDCGVFIIEDNAQAIGARSGEAGKMTGALGIAAAFSFYPTKNIGAIGDAGAVTTSDPEIASAVRALANYGSDRRYHNIYEGYNCRLDEIQAAILRVKLNRLSEITARRQHTADIYLEAITNPETALPCRLEGDTQVWHQFVVRTRDRDGFRAYLDSCGIGSDVHYAVPPHLQPCYAGRFTEPLPLTEALAESVVSLPIAGVSDEDARRVTEAINSWRTRR